MKTTPAKRRHSLLATLYFCEQSTERTRNLMVKMYNIHGIVMSSALVRSDLGLLAEVGLVTFKDDTAQITERGRDVAQGNADFPALE